MKTKTAPAPGWKSCQADALLPDNIAVHSDHQGRGAGQALLKLAEAEAGSQGYRELQLYTPEMMTENIAWYTRRGWVETHRGHQAGYRRIFMHKRLSSPDGRDQDGSSHATHSVEARLRPLEENDLSNVVALWYRVWHHVSFDLHHSEPLSMWEQRFRGGLACRGAVKTLGLFCSERRRNYGPRA
jgi:hypothetical protein